MSHRFLALGAACGAALLVWFLFGRGGGGALDYAGSWQEAQALAAETKRPILLNFGGPW